MPPWSSSFLSAFIAEQMSYAMGYPFDQFGSAVLATAPLKTLPTGLWWLLAGTIGERALMLASALLITSQNTGASSPPFQLTIHSAAMWGLLWGKLTPSQSDLIQVEIIWFKQFRRKLFTLLTVKQAMHSAVVQLDPVLSRRLNQRCPEVPFKLNFPLAKGILIRHWEQIVDGRRNKPWIVQNNRCVRML